MYTSSPFLPKAPGADVCRVIYAPLYLAVTSPRTEKQSSPGKKRQWLNEVHGYRIEGQEMKACLNLHLLSQKCKNIFYLVSREQI